jgi:hypothetical protein
MTKDLRINSDLETLLNALLKDAASDDTTLTFEEKLQVVDRGIKLEMFKAKIKDDEFGRDFDAGDDTGQT